MKKYLLGATVGVIVAGLVATVVVLAISLSSSNNQKVRAQEKYQKAVSDLKTIEKNTKELNDQYMEMSNIIYQGHPPTPTFWSLFLGSGIKLKLVLLGAMSARGATSQETRECLDQAQKILQYHP